MTMDYGLWTLMYSSRNLNRGSSLQVGQKPFVFPLPHLGFQFVADRFLDVFVERLDTGIFTFGQADDMKSVRLLHKGADLACRHLEQDSLCLRRLDLAMAVAPALAVAVGTIAVIELTDELEEIGALAGLGDDRFGCLSSRLTAGILAGVDENILPDHAILNLELLGMLVVVLHDLFESCGPVQGGHYTIPHV